MSEVSKWVSEWVSEWGKGWLIATHLKKIKNLACLLSQRLCYSQALIPSLTLASSLSHALCLFLYQSVSISIFIYLIIYQSIYLFVNLSTIYIYTTYAYTIPCIYLWNMFTYIFINYNTEEKNAEKINFYFCPNCLYCCWKKVRIFNI